MAHHHECVEIRDYLIGVSGLTVVEKKAIALEHLQLMMTNTDYFEYIHDYTGHWWDQDTKGFTYSKKKQLEIYLKIEPFGGLSCSEIDNFPVSMHSEVGSYAVPTDVLTRIASIQSANAPTYTPSNFKVQDVNNGIGVVNVDYYPVDIATLPKTSAGVRMTPLEFLEYFRKNINSFATSTSVFSPYYHYVAGSVNIDEASKFNSANISSKGAVVHIDIPLDDGTVVESDYYSNTTTNNYWFTFTTMTSVLDGSHPLGGNRRFGLFPKAGGGYTFYIAGVDRIWSWSTALANWGSSDYGFESADELWAAVQTNVKNYVSTHSGTASLPSGTHTNWAARVDWEGTAKLFLQGQITLEQLKISLDCP